MQGDRPGDDGARSRAEARCPRCGYDQRGVIASWAEVCPLQGTCAECGLVFDWPELLSSKVIKPRWCVEYGRWWATPLRTVRTLFMALWPRRFWATLKMTHPPRWGRLAVFFVLLVGPLLLSIVATHGFHGWRNWQKLDQQINEYNLRLPAYISAATAIGPQTITMPDGTTRSIRTTTQGLTPITNPITKWQAIGQYACLPWSDTSLTATGFPVTSGLLWGTGAGISQVFPTPREVMKDRVRIRGGLRPLRFILLFALLIQALVPLGLVVAPVSRRIARVRWSHIVRIAACGLLSLWIPLLAIMLMLPTGTDPVALEREALTNWTGIACFMITPLALLLWWQSAVRHYLKMPQAWTVAGSVLAMAMLLLMLCGYFDFIINQWPGGYLFITGQG